MIITSVNGFLMSLVSIAVVKLTFTFRVFSRHFCPKRLTVSTIVTRKKPQYITVDKEKERKKK